MVSISYDNFYRYKAPINTEVISEKPFVLIRLAWLFYYLTATSNAPTDSSESKCDRILTLGLPDSDSFTHHDLERNINQNRERLLDVANRPILDIEGNIYNALVQREGGIKSSIDTCIRGFPEFWILIIYFVVEGALLKDYQAVIDYEYEKCMNSINQ